jgi:hypothetical protein
MRTVHHSNYSAFSLLRLLFVRLFVALSFCCAVISGGTARNAHAEALALPAVGAWNGFLRHSNILECNNASELSYDFVVTVRNNNGGTIGSQAVHLPPFATSHLALDPFGIGDAYGTLLISTLSGEPQGDSPLNCNTVIYRFPSGPRTRSVDYAFALPVRNSLRGSSAGIFNSYNPAGTGVPVANWLSVVNPGGSPFSASVQVFDQDGNYSSALSFFIDALQVGERRDFALGHPQGERVGLYRIIPASPNAPYSAFLTRYSSIGPDTFNFAFPVSAQAGSCDPGPIPASTMDPAMNWGEIANPTDAYLPVSIEIRDASGALRYSDNAVLPPRTQKHVYINDSLGERNVGTLHVRCLPDSADGRVLVESAFYGFRFLPAASLEWGYVSQGRGDIAAEGDRISFPINTYLGAANWAKFLDAGEASSLLNSAVYNLGGNDLTQSAFFINADGGVDVGVHERTGADYAGQLLSYSNTPASALSAEMLRVYPDSRGGIGSIMNVPPRIVAAGIFNRGAVRAVPGEHFFEFRGRKIAIVGDSITQGWMELGSDFNTTGYLDLLHSKGINALMIWSYIGIVNQAQDPRVGYHAPRRWPWVELSGRMTPPYQFRFVDAGNQAVFNESYFSTLRDLVSAANERDILVLITIHDGWTKDRFTGHPLNQANGGPLSRNADFVNLFALSREMPTTFDPNWNGPARQQYYLERFTDRLIRATSEFPNVMYEIFNEGEWYDPTALKNFEEHFIDFIKARTDRPVILNDTGTLNNSFVAGANIDSVAYHSPNWSSATSAASTLQYYAGKFNGQGSSPKPILFDEPVPNYQGGDIFLRNGLMRLMWGTLLGGGGFFVPNDVAWHFPTGANDPVFDYSSAAANFFNNQGLPLGDLRPAASLASNGSCMAAAGNHYIIYTQAGAAFTLNLNGVSGNFEMRFFSPRTGVFYPGSNNVTGGGIVNITPPSADDWVVWLRRV